MTHDDFLPLSLNDIKAAINPPIRDIINKLMLKTAVTSTNDVLWQYIEQGHHGPAICLSESQSAGRGRQGDHWYSPASGNLYLSILWPFPAEMNTNGLSIAIGISLVNTLNSLSINNLSIKWPNDILHKRKKLAGILVESRFGIQQNIVVGIGLNIKLPIATQSKIKQPTTSLQQLCNTIPCRNRLAGNIIQNMIDTLQLFQQQGLAPFVSQWPQYDALANQTITLVDNDKKTNVIAHGINELGELRYQHNGQLKTLSNSHISIRFAS